MDGLGLGGRTFSLTVAPMVAQGRAYGAAIALVDTTDVYAAAETSERLRRESEFYVDLMSHDIRNFNQVSMGYIEMLGMSESLTPDDRAFLDKAMSGVIGSNKLINDIKRVRAIRESGDKNIGPADLGKIIKGDIAHVKGAHEGTTLIVNEDIGPGRMVMANDFVHFVFQHIMENAIKYDLHPEKVIDVDVSESREDGRGWWTVRMADRGPGLPEERKKSIFERMAGGTTRGAGLGLSIVRLILDRLGGRIWVEDRVPGDPSQGSVFVVQLRKA
jgi:signal transduction histidine kinase